MDHFERSVSIRHATVNGSYFASMVVFHFILDLLIPLSNMILRFTHYLEDSRGKLCADITDFHLCKSKLNPTVFQNVETGIEKLSVEQVAFQHNRHEPLQLSCRGCLFDLLLIGLLACGKLLVHGSQVSNVLIVRSQLTMAEDYSVSDLSRYVELLLDG
jgi:hypothetical protein